MAANLESEIDQLYKLPLEQFTKARNAVAKEFAGDAKQRVQSLAKPPLPLWAINQLYWQDPGTYNALIDAAEKLRAAHRSVLSGRATDLRKPEQVHRAALERAIARTVGILQQKGTRVSDAVIHTTRQILSALPGDERAGRLSHVPEPSGFSLLAGVNPRAIKASAAQKPTGEARTREKMQAEQQRRLEEAKRRQEEARKRKEETERRAAAKAKAKEEIRLARQALRDAERRLANIEDE